MDENNIVIKRRVDRMFHHWGLDIIKTVDGISLPDFPDYKVSAMHVKYKFLMMILTIQATEHRIGIKISGPNLNNKITGTDPLKDNLKLRKVYPTD